MSTLLILITCVYSLNPVFPAVALLMTCFVHDTHYVTEVSTPPLSDSEPQITMSLTDQASKPRTPARHPSHQRVPSPTPIQPSQNTPLEVSQNTPLEVSHDLDAFFSAANKPKSKTRTTSKQTHVTHTASHASSSESGSAVWAAPPSVGLTEGLLSNLNADFKRGTLSSKQNVSRWLEHLPPDDDGMYDHSTQDDDDMYDYARHPRGRENAEEHVHFEEKNGEEDEEDGRGAAEVQHEADAKHDTLLKTQTTMQTNESLRMFKALEEELQSNSSLEDN